MSNVISVSKKLPLSVSLGATKIFSLQENLQPDLLANLSYYDKRSFLFEQENFVLVCGNKVKRPKVSQPNDTQMSLVVRRALALKNHTKKAVLLVVNDKYEGGLIAEKFSNYASCFKVYTSNKSINAKLHEDICAEFQNEADFEIITYDNFWSLVTRKKTKTEQDSNIERIPKTEQIIFVNPLRKRFQDEDLARLDAITRCYLSHKYKEPGYSFFFDEAWFPILTKSDSQYTMEAKTTIYYRSSEPARSTLSNPIQQGIIPYLNENQYKLFIFTELFRGRKTIKELLRRFQETFTYKFHLLSEGFFSDELNNLDQELIARKSKIDNRIYAGIVEQLNKYTKKYSKSLLGKTDFNINSDTGEINRSNNIIWTEAEQEPKKILPLIYKGENDNKYYLSTLGEAVLATTSYYEDVATNFSAILRYLSVLLYRKGKTTDQLTVKEIIRFFLMLLGVKEEVKDHCLAQIPEELETEEKINELVKFLKTELKQLLAKYSGYSATQILGSFEMLMDTEAYIVYQQLKKKDNTDERTWKEKRQDAILLKANYQPLTVKYTARKYHMLYQHAKRLLESLVKEGRLVKIHTYNHRGKLTYKYCTQELLDAYPHLQKNCGNCLWFRKRFKTCTYLRLQQAFNPSKVKTEYRAYANGKICQTATACGEHTPRADYELADGGTKFTRTIDELSRDLRVVPMSYVTGTETENVYQCFTCQEPIEEFGTDKKLFFPRKRVSCPNCATLYIKNKNEKVTIRTEYRHLLRGLYYKENTSLPKVLLEKDPSYVFVIYDSEQLSIDLTGPDDTTPDLLICNQRIPLDRLQYLYFNGQRYKELEQLLKVLAISNPEKLTYTIHRAETKEKKKEQETNQGIEDSSLQPFSSNQYAFLKDFMTYFHKEGLFIQEFLHARALSNIGAMIAIKDAYELMDYGNWRYEHQLYSMLDVLIKVNGGVRTSYYGSQLEGLSNNYFFELLKDEASQVNLWSWGRVNSRFVIDFFLAYSKSSSAYSPYDALLNQLLRTFRAEINEIFRKVGLEPAKLGPGLFHRRKTKSDIDQLGFYFDLIEPVRVLVLLTMSKAVRKKALTIGDCTFELGERGQEIYRVKKTSQEKISKLVSDALTGAVYYRGEVAAFTQAFEHQLLSLRAAIESCFEQVKNQKQLTNQEIFQIFEREQFAPMVFCPAGKEQQLVALKNLADEEQALFEGREAEVLEIKKFRETFREFAMEKWLLREPIAKNLRVTKHQQKEQDRSLTILSVMLSIAHQQDFGFEWHSTSFLQELLGLTQNQIIRILKQMTTRGLLLEKKIHRSKFYRINLENASVKRLRLALGLTLTREEIENRKLLMNALRLLKRLGKVLSNLLASSDNQLVNTHWNNWEPPRIIQAIATWLIDHIAVSKNYFELIELEGGII